MIELKRLKNKQSNYLPIMNQSISLPTFPISTISSTGPKLFPSKKQNGIRSHTGVYVSYYHIFYFSIIFFNFILLSL